MAKTSENDEAWNKQIEYITKKIRKEEKDKNVLQQRIEKAIEYIERLDKDYDINVYQEDKHWAYILYILKGDDKQ